MNKGESYLELVNRYGESLYKVDFDLSNYSLLQIDDYEIPVSVAVFSMKNTSPNRPDVIVYARLNRHIDQWHATKGKGI